MRRIRNTPEQGAYILMDRVFPPAQQAMIMRPGVSSVVQEITTSELGIFGCFVGDAKGRNLPGVGWSLAN